MNTHNKETIAKLISVVLEMFTETYEEKQAYKAKQETEKKLRDKMDQELTEEFGLDMRRSQTRDVGIGRRKNTL